MDNSAPFDISRVISALKENPQLIKELSALTRNDAAEEQKEEETVAVSEAEPVSASDVPLITVPERQVRSEPQNRQKLLSAFKPYLSSERAKAIDTMLSISDILHSFGGK